MEKVANEFRNSALSENIESLMTISRDYPDILKFINCPQFLHDLCVAGKSKSFKYIFENHEHVDDLFYHQINTMFFSACKYGHLEIAIFIKTKFPDQTLYMSDFDNQDIIEWINNDYQQKSVSSHNL